MEGAHGQLCAGFADRLSGDHTNRLAHIDQTTTTQIAAIALGAQAKARFAIEHGAHLDFIHTRSFDQIDLVFRKQETRRYDHSACLRVNHIVNHGAAQDAVAQGFDGLAAFNDSAHDLAVLRAAVVLNHHQILRHVHQAAGQVA